MNGFLDAARAYRDLGLHPIPVEPRGKRPLVSWKDYQERQPTAEEINAWWTATPDANVALVLGREMFAVDVDTMEGQIALVEKLGADVEALRAAPSSSTGKGRHFFFAGTTGDRVGLLPGIDVRGVGYVVAPPSIHPNGGTYEWITPLGTTLPPAPPSLVALLATKTREPQASTGTNWFTQALVGVAEGGRDSTCTRLAGYLLGKGLPAEAVEIILEAWAGRCTPPFPADQVIKCVTSIAKREGPPPGPPAPLRDVITAALKEITAPPASRPPAVATDLGSLDALLDGGFYPGDYVLLGARPSVGKTVLALSIARRRAKAGQGVLFASLEMTPKKLARRLLVMESQVRAHAVKTGDLTPLELQMLTAAAERMADWPLWIAGGNDVRTVERLEEALSGYDPGALSLGIVDYLQLMHASSGVRDSRQRVEEISDGLRRITNKYELPLLVLSSLSRPAKDRPNWEPTLSDLRESGELEHDADVVLLMNAPALVAGREDDGARKVNVAKSRDGKVGAVHLHFEGALMRFEEVR